MALTVSGVIALDTANADWPPKQVMTQEQCWPIMEKVGLSKQFPLRTGHTIHSLTLQDIWHYFDLNATATNKVPTVNRDLNAKDAILEHAPNVGYEDKFQTMAMRGVDEILSHMDNPQYSTFAYYSPLEKLVHGLHMQEMWTMTSQSYQELVKNPPSKEVCSCVKDVANNGILKMLHYIAMFNKYTQDMAGIGLTLDRFHPETYKYDPHEFLQHINPNKSIVEQANGLISVLVHFKYGGDNEWTGEIEKMVRLKDEASWQMWKDVLFQFHNSYDPAVFLYCTLSE